jgi:hypothetical protein
VAHDGAGHLVAEDHRRRAEVLLCPRVPALDVDVRAAHARGFDADEQLTRSRLRRGHLADRGTGRRLFLDHREHRGRDPAVRTVGPGGQRLGPHGDLAGGRFGGGRTLDALVEELRGGRRVHWSISIARSHESVAYFVDIASNLTTMPLFGTRQASALGVLGRESIHVRSAASSSLVGQPFLHE